MNEIDLNAIGNIICHEFSESVYFGGAVLQLSIMSLYEYEYCDSCMAVGSTAVVDVCEGSFYGEIVGVLFDDLTGQLDVLLKLKEPEAIIEETDCYAYG